MAQTSLSAKTLDLDLTKEVDRISEWMRNIYKSIRTLNVELNDDIRRVYDRMLASEEAIKEAEDARAYAPLFAAEAKLKEPGIDAAGYHALCADATADARKKKKKASR